MLAGKAVPGNAGRRGAARDQSARAVGAVEWALGCWLCRVREPSLRPSLATQPMAARGPTPRRPPDAGVRTAPRSGEGGVCAVVGKPGGRGGVCAGSPIWRRQVWCGELLCGYMGWGSSFFGTRGPISADDSIHLLPSFFSSDFFCDSRAASHPQTTIHLGTSSQARL